MKLAVVVSFSRGFPSVFVFDSKEKAVEKWNQSVCQFSNLEHVVCRFIDRTTYYAEFSENDGAFTTIISLVVCESN